MKCNQKRKISARLSALALGMIVTLSCVSYSAASGLPAIHILENTDARAGDVTISVDVTNFKLGSNNGGQGRIIYYLDASIPTYYYHSAISKAGTYAISTETSYTWKGITPGAHTFSVQLVGNSNSPLPNPVFDSVTIRVGTPEGTPQLNISNPANGDSLPPGNILIVVEVNNFIISRADFGVIIRAGEGHLMYYIDENPPSDHGKPATTNTSIVSTDASHLWKGVTQGKHTFSAQLVNNDDTPLETPVVATVTIDVKP